MTRELVLDRWVGDWWLQHKLGSGGQGTVYFALRISKLQVEAFTKRFRQSNLTSSYIKVTSRPEPHGLALFFEAFQLWQELPRGAVKHFHSPADARNPAAQPIRARREVAVMRSITSSGLIPILDAGEDWLVVPYFKNGHLGSRAAKYCGNPLLAIDAIIPIVSGVALLHDDKVVHRDIKPDNIFVADDESLVLGDFGLVIPLGSDTRITGPSESVGTRDFMPPWTIGGRDESPDTAHDTFGLAKTIWWMLSGGRHFRLHLFDEPDVDLRRQFADSEWPHHIHEFFGKVLVDRRSKVVLTDANTLLPELLELREKIARVT